MPIENIRLSAKAKDNLISLKRKTGIGQWNILCRWGFCLSLATEGDPPPSHIPADSNVEMDWKTFAGEFSDIYWGLLLERCKYSGVDISDDKEVAHYFRLHLHRGIQYLAADQRMKKVEAFLNYVPTR